MCDKCDDKERMEKIGCSLCTASKLGKSEKIDDINRIATEEDVTAIDKELKKKHEEVINGYDNQLVEQLRDLANFTTKMLIMFEDYRKKGDVLGMTKILESIRDYGMLSQTSSAVIITTANMLLDRMRGAQ